MVGWVKTNLLRNKRDIFLSVFKFMRVSLGKDILGFLYTQELCLCACVCEMCPMTQAVLEGQASKVCSQLVVI